MSKLHELLAVEGPLKKAAETATNQATQTFNNPANFTGFVRTYSPFVEDGVKYPEERLELSYTVDDLMAKVNKNMSKYFDAVLQKEETNQNAKADIIIDDKVIANDLPATFLLGLEAKLSSLRKIYLTIPTLSDSIKWVKDVNKGKGVYVAANDEQVLKTAKTVKSKTLYEATEHHPAQIDRWEEATNVGLYSKKIWSGMLSTADKNKLIEKIDKLSIAVKKARQRANNTDVVKKQIGKDIFNYIHS
jgi:hypothetical protein